jgi:hypothetical protein
MPSVLNVASDTCKSCTGLTQCRTSALETLHRIRDSISVEDLIHELRVGYEVKPVLQNITLVASMPTKVAKRLNSLLSKGFERSALSALQDGHNPFPPNGAKHMHLVGELLLQGSFTKGDYRRLCIAKFGWKEGTAFSEVSMAIALLRGLGLATVDGDVVHSTAKQTTESS